MDFLGLYLLFDFLFIVGFQFGLFLRNGCDGYVIDILLNLHERRYKRFDSLGKSRFIGDLCTGQIGTGVQRLLRNRGFSVLVGYCRPQKSFADEKLFVSLQQISGQTVKRPVSGSSPGLLTREE